MVLTKIALSLLGTIALTAGTLLAVAEPGSAPLPTAQPSKCDTCPAAAIAALPQSCKGGSCKAAGTACAAESSAAPVSACSKNRCAIVRDTATSCPSDSCPTDSRPAKDGNADDARNAKAGSLLIGTGITSNSGVQGTVIFAAGVETDSCAKGECPAETFGCSGHDISVAQFDGKLFKANKTTTVYIKNCRECAAAGETMCAGDCDKAECSAKECSATECTATECTATECSAKKCSAAACPQAKGDDTESVSVVATTCEARPACATDACSLSACAATEAACNSATAAYRTFGDSAVTAGRCDSCENCACDSCDCRRSAASPPAPAIEIRPLLEDDAPGRVRLTHVVPNFVHFRDDVHYSRDDVHPFPNDVHYFPTGREFAPASQRIRLSSFAAPIAAPLPHAVSRSQARPSIDGSWKRTIDEATIEFTIRNGSLHGTCGDVRFSGTCSVTDDGQVFGLMHEFDGIGALPLDVIDQPFAVRYVFDGDELILKDFRCAGLPASLEYGDEGTVQVNTVVRMILCGRFTAE